MARCKSCGAEILFVTMRNTGKKMPVDKERLSVVLANNDLTDGHIWQDCYKPHWATCNNPDKFRKES